MVLSGPLIVEIDPIKVVFITSLQFCDCHRPLVRNL